MDLCSCVLFGSPETPAEMAKRWQKELNRVERRLERQILQVERTEREQQQTVKRYLKQDQYDAATTLARELIVARHQSTRLYQARAAVRRVLDQVRENAVKATILKTSADATAGINEMLSLREVREVAQVLSKEMLRAEFISDIVDMGNDDNDDEPPLNIPEAAIDTQVLELLDELLVPTEKPKREIKPRTIVMV